MADHLQQYKTDILPVVIPIVLYNGKSTYGYSTDIFTLFGKYNELAKEVLLKPFYLIDLNIIDDFTMDIESIVNGINIRNIQYSEIDREHGLLTSYDHYLTPRS